jgi:hypothetical protein
VQQYRYRAKERGMCIQLGLYYFSMLPGANTVVGGNDHLITRTDVATG